MTEETCKERLQVARLDRTQPPPNWLAFYSADGPWWRAAPYDGEHDGEQYATRRAAIAAAWAHYEREHDPPGMRVVGRGGLSYNWDVWPRIGKATVEGPGLDASRDPCVVRPRPHHREALARAAAWAWYWRRREVADRLDADVVVLVEFGDGGISSRVPTPRANVAAALRPMLTMADDEDAEAETIAEVERLFSEGRLTFEGDPPIELEKVDAWPAALAWSSDQTAAVERWLADGGELPEVLRA